MELFLKIHSGMANSIYPDQTASFRSSLFGVCIVCICHFGRHFGVQNFSTFTVPKLKIQASNFSYLCYALRKVVFRANTKATEQAANQHSIGGTFSIGMHVLQ